MITDLQTVILKKAIWKKDLNGQRVLNEYKDVDTFYVFKQNIEDQISASVYGANINKMLRIESIRHELEVMLCNVLDNPKDKISDYFIFFNSILYKITSVNEFKVDIERL